MNKVELSTVLDLLIAENKDEASNMLHEWFVGKSKAILEELMQEDDHALNGIQDDKDEIASEEYYGDADLGEAEGDEEGIEGAEGEFGSDEDEVAGEDDFAGDDLDGTMDADIPVEDKVDSLEAQLAQLKAEFDKLMGAEGEEGDEFAGDEMSGDFEGDSEDGSDVQESVFESDEDEDDKEGLDEDFTDLEESFELEKVKDPDMSEGSEAGNGGKATVTKNSPIPQKKTGERVGGAAVEMKGKTYKGYAREQAPGVNDKPILKNQVRNAKADLVPVTPQGDKSALLNKGPTPDKGKSPIGGGAVDLRGDDMKRK